MTGAATDDWQPEALAAYGLAPPLTIAPLDGPGGVNNQVRVVRAGGRRFLWKAYLTHADPARIRAEHRLLAWLAGAGLPFAVPTPLAAGTGETLPARADGGPRRALFPFLPGGRLDRADPAVIAALGAALGALHGALARLPVTLRPPLTPMGALDQIHPAIPDPYGLTPAALGLPDTPDHAAMLADWRATLAGLRPFLEGPYRDLPRQVIHGDFGPGNALAGGTVITAILDFEFALHDARACDVASGLSMVARSWEWEPDRSLALAAAFLGGYARQVRLTDPEIAALPGLILLREIVAATWWLGRERAAPGGAVRTGCFAGVRDLAAWLERHGAALRARAVAAR